MLPSALLGFSSQLLENLGNIVSSPDFVLFTPYVFEVDLPEFSQIDWNIRTCDPDASRLDGQGLLPHSPDMFAAVEEFLWKVVTLVGVVYAKNRDGIALHVTLRRSKAYVSSVKMKMPQFFIKSQSGRLSQDQHDLIECLDLCRLGRDTDDPDARGIHMTSVVTIACHPTAP